MRPQFEKLFRNHCYNVRTGSFFNVGSGWEHSIRQASAALTGLLPVVVWIVGGRKEEGSLVLDLEIPAHKPTLDTAQDILRIVRETSLKTCEACGKSGSLRPHGAVRCDEHTELLSLEEAAKLIEVDKLHLMHIIDVGDVVPALVILHDGTVWHEKAEFGFTSADIIRFQEERDRRRFKHVHEQFGYVVPATAKFECGPGWETVIRRLADKLGAFPGPPKLVGGKEKFGSFQSRIVAHSPKHDERIDDLVREARKLSLTLCDECGAPGRLRMGHSIAKTTCDRHAFLAEPLRDDDGLIVDLPPLGGPIYADGYQGHDREPSEVEWLEKRKAAGELKSEITDTKDDNVENNRHD
ncbi:hypothetical protein G6L68_25240 [Agrobacterium fabrum]|uniref:hypothetical protein n=1 Tax=Agrobacterium fabrum TaxID=1176649 RepID=UPI000EF61BDC|nr:hypothetical protein [Agrobacterium fabrum]AYM66192.1 hypothetical protein At12D13_50400 [Agrobacterium fabrum]NTE63939.1 hypothetical protein [Agrobacterium fabrum]